ncbi:flagellar biosynthesis protein FlhF [Fusibacter tunisiensis]|uniref:Flagellar biosynthesis protein FlhF n=1 Tax=Fusibacter tunisiensis TaxID=1008308 RepID=A0ABS2MMH2_9FIRM|nr:flagellar biosynthesis protein FlhF [Fusibacter tunisiensis]MBM7560603.1 flagellar biosynthesis protein FlhF [Fusibacter tunisiensis]
MKVKRYLVNDMSEAMIKIKNELGMDAVILNTRKIKTGGFLGLFKKTVLEVVAAIDEPVLPKKTRQVSENNSRPEHVQPVKEPVVVNSEMMELKKMVQILIEKVDHIEHTERAVQVDSEPAKESVYIDYLKEKDIQESIAKKIMEIVQRQISINEKNHESILNAMKVIAREYLGEVKTIDRDLPGNPGIYLFLGPTGVGKTTTLAKIAARLTLVENKSIGLITADTYRIAAVEQLKTYSEILGIPLEVIYEASELESALYKFKDKDYVLIDTAGRSHKSKELQSDFDELMQFIDHATIFLVMSMTTGFKDMKNIIDSYKFLEEYRLLFTKLDEATAYGNILNLKVLTGKPLSYVTTGQSVPDDIEEADREKIIQIIFDEA